MSKGALITYHGCSAYILFSLCYSEAGKSLYRNFKRGKPRLHLCPLGRTGKHISCKRCAISHGPQSNTAGREESHKGGGHKDVNSTITKVGWHCYTPGRDTRAVPVFRALPSTSVQPQLQGLSSLPQSMLAPHILLALSGPVCWQEV